MVFSHFHLPVLSCILLLPFAYALSNVTVDDSREDVIFYSPPDVWIANGSDNNGSLPDSQLVNNGTWQFASNDASNSTSNHVNLTTTFNGSAVYVFAILQRETLTAVDFWINGTRAGAYSHTPDTTSAFLYNTTIYANSSLPPGEHVFSVTLSATDASVFFFDSLIYGTSFSQASPDKIQQGDNENLGSDLSDSITSTSPPDSVQSLTLPVIVGSTGSNIQTTDTTSSSFLFSTSPPSIPSSQATRPTTSQSFQAIGTTNSLRPVAASSSSLSSRHTAVIVGAAAGGGALIVILLVGAAFCYRRKKARKYKVNPFVTPHSTPTTSPNAQEEFSKMPVSASSTRPFLARLSFQTVAESTTTGITLTDEIFPLPSEVEDVFNQLEALSAEVQKFRETESEHVPQEQQSRPPRTPTPDVHANFEQIRAEVQRLRYRSGSPSAGQPCTTGTSPLTMLRELDLLRAELQEILAGQPADEASVERLPSYHSRKTVDVRHRSEEVPPPLPTAHTEKNRLRTRS